ncbi:hypothetical protein [Mesorhizobium sp. URHB0026]
MGSEATMRSHAALLASEMVSALQQLSPESRLEVLALATSETLLDPNHGGDATSLMEAYIGRLTSTVQKSLQSRSVAPRRPHVSLGDNLKAWLAADPRGKLRIILKDQGDLGALLILSWHMESKPTQYDSNYYATRKDAMESLNRDVLEPAGMAAIPYTRKLNWRLPKRSERNARDPGGKDYAPSI